MVLWPWVFMVVAGGSDVEDRGGNIDRKLAEFSAMSLFSFALQIHWLT
jgi:hypothetical protein